MHYIFVGDKPIILTTTAKNDKHIENFKLKGVDVKAVLKSLNQKKVREVRLIHKNEKRLLKHFLKLLPNVVAGGGKVFNHKEEILFIYRNDKWDLPKGKAEKKETIQETAIREVEEETGVKDLKIIAPLPTTYHIFKRNNVYRIKITYWFKMKTDYDGPLVAQLDEGITKVKWLNEKKVKKALDNSYANIRQLI